MAETKSTGTAMFLNFLIPGAGHLYADGRPGLLMVNLGAAMVGGLLVGCSGEAGFLVLTAPVNFICMVFGLATAGQVVEEHNNRIYKEAESWRSADRDQEERQRLKAKAEEKRRAEQEAARKKVEASKVSGATLAQKFAQVQALASAGALNADEVKAEKQRLIATVVSGWTDEELLDFLGPMAELARQNLATNEDVATAKAVFAALPKKPRNTA